MFFRLDFAAGRGLRTALHITNQHVVEDERGWERELVPDSLVKHALQVALSECGALEVLMCADLLGDGQGLLVRDGLHLAGAQGFGGGAVVSQVELGADQDDGDVGGMVLDLGVPLLRSVSGKLDGQLGGGWDVPWLSRYRRMAG